jgi:RNA polymerase sigma-70 factor (sigma-E family)
MKPRQATRGLSLRLWYMEPNLTADDIGRGRAASGPARQRATDAETVVTALYQAHAVGLIRLAVVMLGDRSAAEDVVQEAFAGLYRRWDHLYGADRALGYTRASVLNGCRSRLRARVREKHVAAASQATLAAASAEQAVLIGEEHAAVLTALRRLPDRQREALVLRYYLDLSELEIAAWMGIGRGTVKSTTSRALAALGRLLEETQ